MHSGHEKGEETVHPAAERVEGLMHDGPMLMYFSPLLEALDELAPEHA